MSLEQSVERLARAIEDAPRDIAVKEIIRQRDKAQAELKQMTSNCNFYKIKRDESDERRYKLERKNAALRGVITRMKRLR